MTLALDIAARIERDFSPGDAQAVKELLIELQREDARTFGDRQLRCAVYLAHGNFSTLAYAITLGRSDYRDLIMAAEYEKGTDRRLRDFNNPFDGAV
jgi:hypothetical protein